MSTSTIRTAKGTIEFRISGRGKPLLFVHGGHVDANETLFEKGLRLDMFLCLTPSRPGYGRTPITVENKSPRGTAELFVALLDELELTNVTVIGISAGGLTALEIAAGFSNRVSKLVLMSAISKKWFETSSLMYLGAKMVFGPSAERYTWFLYKGALSIFTKLTTTVMFMSLSKYRPVSYSRSEGDEVRELTKRMRSHFGFYNDLHQTIDERILQKIQCSTLILHSENDNSVDTSHPENARRNVSNSTLVMFSNRWGHLLWVGEECENVLRELEEHIT